MHTGSVDLEGNYHISLWVPASDTRSGSRYCWYVFTQDHWFLWLWTESQNTWIVSRSIAPPMPDNIELIDDLRFDIPIHKALYAQLLEDRTPINWQDFYYTFCGAECTLRQDLPDSALRLGGRS